MAEVDRKRKRYFKVHLLDEELNILNAKADEAGMSKSEYIRNMILWGAAHQRTVFTKEGEQAIIYELNKMGNNLNQIAFIANANKSFDERDFQSLYHNYIDLLSAFERLARGKEYGNY